MRIIKQGRLILLISLLIGCENKADDNKHHGLGTIAQIGNGGSLDGPYSMREIWITSVNGGRANFGYGAVNGYPGKTADIGGIGVPRHISGYWAKKNKDSSGFEAYYRISADIDSELAEQKVRTLQNYYQTFKSQWGRMQVEVEKSRIMVLYTQGCYGSRVDCSVKEGADPNGYVIRSPSNSIDVVALFDDKGESSVTPFPGSPYDARTIHIEPRQLGQGILLTDTEGRTGQAGDWIGDLTTIQGQWKQYVKTDESGKSVYRYFKIDSPINTAMAKKSIQTLRSHFPNESTKSSNTYVHIHDGNIKIYYALYCIEGDACEDTKNKDRTELFEVLDDVNSLGILLFQGKADETDTPPIESP